MMLAEAGVLGGCIDAEVPPRPDLCWMATGGVQCVTRAAPCGVSVPTTSPLPGAMLASMAQRVRPLCCLHQPLNQASVMRIAAARVVGLLLRLTTNEGVTLMRTSPKIHWLEPRA